MNNPLNTKETLPERKKIAGELIERVFTNYPEWRGDLNLPKPSLPKSLQNVKLSDKQMAKVPLDAITLSVLCGTIVGDTSLRIQDNCRNARFLVRVSTRQCEWFTWKYLVMLRDFCESSAVVYYYPTDMQIGSKKLPCETTYGKLNLNSKKLEPLTKVYDIVSIGNKTVMQRFWLNHMNNYFLMTLWLDDGGLMNHRQGRISFNSKTTKEQDDFIKYMSRVWGVTLQRRIKRKRNSDGPSTPILMKNNRINCVLDFLNQDNLLKFLEIIAPVIPVRQMLYKVCFFTEKNTELTQRWKTKLKTLVRPEFSADIDVIYSKLSERSSDNLKEEANTIDN